MGGGVQYQGATQGFFCLKRQGQGLLREEGAGLEFQQEGFEGQEGVRSGFRCGFTVECFQSLEVDLQSGFGFGCCQYLITYFTQVLQLFLSLLLYPEPQLRPLALQYIQHLFEPPFNFTHHSIPYLIDTHRNPIILRFDNPSLLLTRRLLPHPLP